MCVCVRAYQLYCLSSPPRIAVLTAGYKGLFHNCKNKVHVVVVVVNVKLTCIFLKPLVCS